MDEFKVIVIMNEAMIKLLKDKNANYERNLKIEQYLKYEALFIKNYFLRLINKMIIKFCRMLGLNRNN